MKLKKIIACMCSIGLICTSTAIYDRSAVTPTTMLSAYSAEIGVYGPMTYEVKTDAGNNKYISIINCDESITGTLVIPNVIKGIPVKEIGKTDETGGAFNYCKGITSIEFPSTLTTIGAAAFYGCSNLTSVHIPGNVLEIGAGAFLNCFISDLKIGMGVRTIGHDAFWQNPLTTVDLPKSVEFIDIYAFHACGYLQTIYIRNPNCVIDTSVATTLGVSPTICGYEGSTAQTFAIVNSKNFFSLGAAPAQLIGDVNLDDVVDAMDGSEVLTAYAKLQTGQGNVLSSMQQKAADVNNDRTVDAIDASGILTYYARISTGQTPSWS